MEEKDGELYNKDVKLKGIDTTEGVEPDDEKKSDDTDKSSDGGTTKTKSPQSTNSTPQKSIMNVDYGSSPTPEPSPYLSWKEPETEQEAFEQSISTSLGQPGKTSVKGDTGLIDERAYQEAIAPINLGEYIPDPLEREKFLNEKGEALFQLDESTYGITFENDVKDLLEFKKREYPKRMKRFLDELDENQNFVSEMYNIGSRFLGSTAIAVSSIIPTIYGLGNAAIEGDSSKIFDNPLFDAWDGAQDWVTKGTVIYGGSDIYNINKEGEFEQKEFFARFWNDPIKSMNQDVVPAASFVAGAIVTELLAGIATPATGGTALAGNTARLAAQAKRLFSTNKFFNTSMKAVKGLDDNILQMAKLKNSAQFKKIQQSLNKATGTAIRGYRSAAYESALIARDTQERTLNNLLIQHHKNNGGEVNEEGFPIGEMDKLNKNTLAKYKKMAAEAGEMSYFMNVPLVAGSNFVQFPKLMMRNHALSSLGAKALGKKSLKGTRYLDGKRIANVNTNKYTKALGYTTAFVKRPISEAWEEFAQEAMGEGLVDYYTSNYSKEGAFSYTGMLSAIAQQGSSVLSTAEGRDAVTIGALMGMLGLRLPVKINQETGKLKFSLKGEQYGGSLEAVNDLRKKYSQAKVDSEKEASILNSDLDEQNVNPTLASNFRSAIRHMEAQQNMDSAAIEGDINEYKNQEHKQMFTFIQNRMNQGLEDSVLEDINIERESSLEEFNKKYSRKDEQEFTEETKKEAIDKAEKRAKGIIADIKTVRTHVENNEHTGANRIGFAIRKMRGNTSQKPLTPAELETVKGMQEQIAYLYSSVENSKEREQSLAESIRTKSKNTFDIGLLDAIKATPKGIVTDSETGKSGITFESNATEVVSGILQEWKKQSPEEYNLHSETVKQELKDIIKLKIRRARAAAMYKGMFTYKGAKAFREFANELAQKRDAKINEELEKNIKKQAKTAKNASINKVADNERSIFGSSPITDEKIRNDIRKGVKEYDALNKDALSPEGVFQEIVDILDKHPGLLGTLIREGKERGKSFHGIKTAKEIILNDSEDRQLEIATVNLMNQISKQWKEEEASSKNAPEFKDSSDYNQPAKGEEATEGTTEFSTNDTEKLDASIHKERNLFVNVNEKALEQIEGKWVAVRDKDGKPLPHPMSKRDAYKVNFEKVNSPAFLNNEVLEKENHEFEFRIPEDNEWNQREETTTENLWIDIIHVDPTTKEETVIGNLEAYRDGSPQHLKNLREEVVRRQELIDNQTENTELVEIKNKKKEVKEKLQELQQESKEAISKEDFDTFTDEGTVSDSILNSIASKVKEGQTLTERETAIFNDKTSKIEELLKETSEADTETSTTKLELVERKENLTTKAKEHYETAIEEHPNKTLEDAEKLQERVDSLTDSSEDKAIKKGIQLFIDEINFENQFKATPEQEVEQDVNEEIQNQIEELKSELSFFNERLTEAMNKDLNFKIKSENDSSIKLISKIKEYNSIKNKKKKESLREEIIEEFGESEFERVVAIENNFDSIVEQIATSGINIFTPKDSSDKFKEC